MSRPLVIFAIAVSLITPATADDQMVVDMSKMTCDELTRLGFQDFAGITMWLSDYYNASVRNTVIDLDQFAQAAKAVTDHCGTSPRATVMSAADVHLVSRCRAPVSNCERTATMMIKSTAIALLAMIVPAPARSATLTDAEAAFVAQLAIAAAVLEQRCTGYESNGSGGVQFGAGLLGSPDAAMR